MSYVILTGSWIRGNSHKRPYYHNWYNVVMNSVLDNSTNVNVISVKFPNFDYRTMDM